MDTIYNLDLGVENCSSDCPPEIYGATVKFMHNMGLLGIKKVNKYGEMEEGYDSDCSAFRKAFFDVHYNANIELSAPEIIEKFKLTTSSENDLAQTLIGWGELTLDMMAEADPSSMVLPWNIYTSLPVCSSFELVTPAGRQSLHYHTTDKRDFGVVQLWKPSRENQFYVLDELKRTLQDISAPMFEEGFSPTKALQEGFHPILAVRNKKRAKNLEKVVTLHKKLLEDPDQVTKFPQFIKKL